MTTLNGIEEVDLAKLLKIHKWSDMANEKSGVARFVAIRLARSFTKQNIAFVGITDGMIGI